MFWHAGLAGYTARGEAGDSVVRRMTKARALSDLAAIGRVCLFGACIVTGFTAGDWRTDPSLAQPAKPPVSGVDFFDPGGYYHPKEEVVIAGHRIEWLVLRTLEYYYEQALHYENPRFIPPWARSMMTATIATTHEQKEVSSRSVSFVYLGGD